MNSKETTPADWESVNSMVKISLGKSIARVRKNRGLTQRDVAKKLGISAGYVGDVERGHMNLTFETLVRFLTAMEVPENDIIKISDFNL